MIDYGDGSSQQTIYQQGTLCQNPPCNGGTPCPGTPCYIYPDKSWIHTWTLPGTYTITIYLYPTTVPINEPATQMSFTMNMADLVRSGGGGICCMRVV